MSQSCSTCGRPPENVCSPCAAGDPPPERLADLQAERDAARRKRLDKLVADVRRDLADLPELYTLLPLFRGLTSGPSEQQGPSVGPRSRPPLNLALVDLADRRHKADADPYRGDAALDRMPHRWRDGQGRMVESPGALRLGPLAILASWSRATSDALWDAGVTHDELGVEACTALCDEAPVRARRLTAQGPCSADPRGHRVETTVAGECAFLLQHLTWCSEQQWFDELAADTKRIRRDLQAATGERDEPTSLPCTVCGWQMQGMGDYDAERGRYPWYRCTGCSKAITTQAELDRVEQKARDVVTLRYAAEELGRPLSTLKEWRQQKLLEPVGRDARGSLYSLTAIRKVGASVRNGVRSVSSGRQ